MTDVRCIYYVEGEHPYIPGIRRSLHSTRRAADKAAKELRDIIRKDTPDVSRDRLTDMVFVIRMQIDSP